MVMMLLGFVGQAFAADLIVGAGQSGTFTCTAGQGVSVTGSALKLTLNGDCGALHVVGSSNTVTVDGVSAVSVEGASNVVNWKRNLSGATTLPIVKVGTGNKVRKI